VMVDECDGCGTIVISTTCDYCGGPTCRHCAVLSVKKDALVIRHKWCKRMKKVIE